MSPLRAEFTKLRTLRSTAWLPVVAAATTVGLSAVVCAVAVTGDPIRLVLSGVTLGQVPLVAAATLAITGEYQTGLIRPTLTATPQRLVLFAAKILALVATILPFCLLGVVAALLAGDAILADFSPADGATLRAAGGAVGYLGLVALMTFGLATAIRGTAPALLTVLALLFLTPQLAQLVTAEPWHTRLEKYAPMNAGLAVLGAYGGAALVLGAVLFVRRDA
ncbi:hypothetical protein [Cryptosporangium aurantiacum]|uniref:ABC-2 type transport system permease protein n=1 Tax=Cryptosporangium aurantiacum TaxID=134849 RepID=A0A1M7RMD8_9ACTN|nr:hypothetical protein [Cryptosporangium aurantiacum]SHN47359.1 hypothetical protein SAMN05443668_1235 [Cryptosporangium aurantiacum]